MVDVNDPCCKRAVDGSEIESAYHTDRLVMGNTRGPCLWVALVGINPDCIRSPFNQARDVRDLFRQSEVPRPFKSFAGSPALLIGE